MKNSMKIHKIAGVLRALQSVTNLGSKCNQTPPLTVQGNMLLFCYLLKRTFMDLEAINEKPNLLGVEIPLHDILSP